MSKDDVFGKYVNIYRALSHVTASGVAQDVLQERSTEEWPPMPQVAGSSGIAKSTGPYTAGPSNVVYSPVAKPTPLEKPRETGSNEPDKSLVTPLNGAAFIFVNELSSTVAQLDDVRTDARSRATWAFVGSLAFASIASLMLIVGVALAFAGFVSPGLITAIGGSLVNGAFGGMLWKLYRSTTKELRDLSSDIRRFRDVSLAVWVAGQIQDQNGRDEALAQLADNIQGRGRHDQEGE